jgi:cytochrome c oxidase accessory protein FixG
LQKKKLYPQSISGKHRAVKNKLNILLLCLYFFASWIRWDRGEGLPNQAMMIDLPSKKIYFFALHIWSDEIYFITIILILSALGLFIFTSLYGRLWCGYTCPQTVFTDIFLKVEEFFQGDRNSRIKLDESYLNREKLVKKSLTYLTWTLISFVFAFSWVSYFYDVFDLYKDIFNLSASNSGVIWLISLTFTTYLFAGFLREKVCIYMCPYGRFQSAMIENSTKVVTYDYKRGEPRAKINENKGDCIDCYKCVLVCPTGIDIRDGMQMECIGCGLCIDACNQVMDKIGKEQNLILYTSANSLENKNVKKGRLKKVLEFKNILYITGFFIVFSLAVISLISKSDLNISILKERSPLFTMTPNGDIRNTFYLKIQNKSLKRKRLELYIEDLKPYVIKIQGIEENCLEHSCYINLDQELENDFKIFIWSKNKIHEKNFSFVFRDFGDNKIYKEKNLFIYN